MNTWEWPDRNITTVCKAIHRVLWAPLNPDSNYWPAKLMLVLKSTVYVRFFGVHSQAEVAVNDCLIYSQERPAKTTGQEQELPTLEMAIKVSVERKTKSRLI